MDRAAFDRLFEESVDEADLAENFAFFVEDHVLQERQTHEEYLDRLRGLPKLVRRLYLAYSAKVCVEGDGFQTYFATLNAPDLMDETEQGFQILGKEEAAAAYRRARDYILSFNERGEHLDLFDPTGDEIYNLYFGNLKAGFDEDLGRFLIGHATEMLSC